MRGEFIDIGGARLYYYAAGTRGSGDPLVLIHGFPGTGHLWGELVPLLPTGHRAVVVDLLGCGRSDVPGLLDLSLAAHADRIARLMETLGIATATVVGHGYGGAVAQALATGWPGRVRALALLHSIGFDVTGTGTIALVRAFLGVARFLPHQILLPGIRRELKRRYADSMRGRRSVEQYLRPFASRAGQRSLIRHVLALSEREMMAIASGLPDVRVPVAILASRSDPAVPASVATRLRGALTHATLDFMDDLRHYSPEEAPERVAEVIDALVRR